MPMSESASRDESSHDESTRDQSSHDESTRDESSHDQSRREEGTHDSHGHSRAAWVAVGVILVASLVMSIAVVIASVTLFVAGAVLVVIGVVAGKVLSRAGFGHLAGTRAAAAGDRSPGLAQPGRGQSDSGVR